MSLSTFDKHTVKDISTAIERALQPIAKELGISITRGHGTFTTANFTLKIECSVKNAQGEVMTKDAAAFTHCACMYGLEANDLGRTFTSMYQTYTIIGLRPKMKAPILATRTDGKIYKFDAAYVKRLLSMTK